MIKRLVAIGVVVLFSMTLFVCPVYAQSDSVFHTSPRSEWIFDHPPKFVSFIQFRSLRELTNWSTDIVRGRIIERYGVEYHFGYPGHGWYNHSIYIVELSMVYKGNSRVGERMEISQMRASSYLVLSYDNEYVFFVSGGGEFPPGIIPYYSVHLFCENTRKLTNVSCSPPSRFIVTYADLQRIAERPAWSTILVLFLSGGVVGFITIKVIKKKKKHR